MTREEAIETLQANYPDACFELLREAVDTAISALRTDGDTISRQAAIEAVYKCTDIFINNLPVMIDKADAYKALEELPSAQLEQSIAEWQKDFREYINMLNIPRDDYNGIMEYIDEVPSAQPDVPDRNVGDTISRQAAIDAIFEHLITDVESEYECGYEDGLKRAVSLLEDMQPAQQWIPVNSGKLPEPNEVDEDGFIKAYLVQDARWMDVARWDGEHWIAWGYGTVLKNVTAWMPLPEPYSATQTDDPGKKS